MKKTLIIAGVAMAFAVPTGAAAADPTPSPKQLAQKSCKEERAADKANFRLTWGTKGKQKENGQNAFRNCVRDRSGAAVAALEAANSDCKTEQGTTDESRAAFDAKYGTNHNHRNAFGKCVSAAAKEAVEEETDARINAAEACREERGDTDESKDAFREKYGTNANKKNAFGKCVSTIAKAQQDDQPEQETTTA